MIWAHIDNGAVMGSSVEILDEISDVQIQDLKIRWSKSLDHIIGIDIKRLEDRRFELSQPGLTQKNLQDYLTTKWKAMTPMHPSQLLATSMDDKDLVDLS